MSSFLDHNQWCRATEGPFSRLCKFASLNVLDVRALCLEAFGVQFHLNQLARQPKYSLIDGRWAKAATNSIVTTLRQTMLDAYCGDWASRIAVCDRVRYCPQCLELGYQSVVHQIVGLENCPLHRSRLHDACPVCGTATPPYALTQMAFDGDYLCKACSRSLWPEWTPAKLFKVSHLQMDETPFLIALDWLKRIGRSHIRWDDHSLWKSREKQSAALTLAVLDKVVPCPFPIAPVSIVVRQGMPSSVTTTLLPSAAPEVRASRLAIYKCITRHIKHLIRLKYRGRVSQSSLLKFLEWGSFAPVSGNAKGTALAHAFAVWRKRSEEDSTLDLFRTRGRKRFAVHLREAAYQWPYYVRIDDGLWGAFIWQVFREDLAAAQAWEEDLLSINGEFESVSRRRTKESRVHEAYARRAEQLSVAECIWPRSITSLVVRSDNRELIYLVAG